MVEGSQLEPDQPVGGTVHLIAEEGEILNVQLPAVLDVVDDEHDRARRLDGFPLRRSWQIFSPFLSARTDIRAHRIAAGSYKQIGCRLRPALELIRSEERRVGKECSCRWSSEQWNE